VTLKEFMNTGFTGGMVAVCGEEEYDIIAVDFEDKTFFLDMGDGEPTEFTLDEVDCVKFKEQS
jgi:hypothetical protein